MSKAITINETGGPDVLQWEDFDPGVPGPGEALIRHEAVGVNYIDIYHRSGLYHAPITSFPAILGMEGAGIVEEIGDQVAEISVGDRVAYAAAPPGSYAQTRRIPSDRLVKLPESVSSNQAAAMMLKGMTARYLLLACYKVKPGDTILVHAAAGGVGSIVCQWANFLGVTVIGTVGSEQKAEDARSYGCHYPLLYNETDWVKMVREITEGRGVDVVYDSVGQSTFMKSLDCLKPMGMMVSFGQSSGPIEPLDLGTLAAKGSLFVTRPSLLTYTEKRADLLAHAKDLFEAVEKRVVKIDIKQSYPLADAAKAHMDIENRKTRGATVLLP